MTQELMLRRRNGNALQTLLTSKNGNKNRIPFINQIFYGHTTMNTNSKNKLQPNSTIWTLEFIIYVFVMLQYVIVKGDILGTYNANEWSTTGVRPPHLLDLSSKKAEKLIKKAIKKQLMPLLSVSPFKDNLPSVGGIYDALYRVIRTSEYKGGSMSQQELDKHITRNHLLRQGAALASFISPLVSVIE